MHIEGAWIGKDTILFGIETRKTPCLFGIRKGKIVDAYLLLQLRFRCASIGFAIRLSRRCYWIDTVKKFIRLS